jgi:Zn-dependent protease
MQAIDVIFYIAILIMSVVIHEVSHGFMAEHLGDDTARRAGRLTLNPIKHLDLFGSIILPVLLYLSAGFAFGWAKPVPYNPNNLRNRRWGTVLVASAGILANLSIAVLFGLLIRFAPYFGLPLFNPVLIPPFYKITMDIVIINIALAIFNLVPLPPLDGSKILFNLLPSSFYRLGNFLEKYSLIFLLLFIVFFSDYLYPILIFVFHLITGLHLS